MPYEKDEHGRWPPAARTDAITAYQLDGPTRASEQTGVPAPTIVRWAKEAGVYAYAADDGSEDLPGKTLVIAFEQRKRQLLDTSAEVAAVALGRIRVELDNGRMRSAKDAAVTYAILVDKFPRLRGADDMPAATDLTEKRARLDQMVWELTHQQPVDG